MNNPVDMTEQLNAWHEAMEGVQSSLMELNRTEQYYQKLLRTTGVLEEDPSGSTPTWVASLGVESLAMEDIIKEPKQSVIGTLKRVILSGFEKAAQLWGRVVEGCERAMSKLLPIMNKSRYQVNYIVEHDLKHVTVKEIDEARFNSHYAKVEPYAVVMLWLKKSPDIAKGILELIQNPESNTVDQITSQLRGHFFKKTDPTEIAKYNPYTPDKNQLPVSQDIEFYVFPYQTKMPSVALKAHGYTPANSLELMKLAAYTMNVVAGTLQAVEVKAKKQGLLLPNLYGKNNAGSSSLKISDMVNLPEEEQRKYIDNAKFFAELLWYLELYKRYSVYFNQQAVQLGKILASCKMQPLPNTVDLEAKAKQNLEDKGMNTDKNGQPATPSTTVTPGASTTP